MESVDAVRLCPNDLDRIETTTYKLPDGTVAGEPRPTSYAMNRYLGPPEDLPAPLAANPAIVAQYKEPFAPKMSQLASTSKTIVMFEAGSGVDLTTDHVESPDWFDESNGKRSATAIWTDVESQVAVGRHGNAQQSRDSEKGPRHQFNERLSQLPVRRWTCRRHYGRADQRLVHEWRQLCPACETVTSGELRSSASRPLLIHY